MIEAKNIKAFRKQNGLTQAALAGLAGVSLCTVKNWERDGISDDGVKRSMIIFDIAQFQKIQQLKENEK